MRKPLSPKINRVAIIGPDAVAALDAYSLLSGGFVDELILIGEQALSLSNAIDDLCRFVPLPHRSRVRLGGFEDAILAPVAIIASGKGCRNTEDEVDLEGLASEFACVGERLRENSFDGVAVVVTEPVDVLSEIFLEAWRGPGERVIGLGPGSAAFDKDDGSDGPLKGETRWCTGGFAHIRSMDACSPGCPYFGAMIEEVAITRKAQPDVQCHSPIEFAACVTQVCNAVIKDTRTVIPVFTKTAPELGFDGAFLNLPAVIGRTGVEGVLKLESEPKRDVRLATEAAAFADTLRRIGMVAANAAERAKV
jgi:L-lactate dehydrogenase